MERTHFSSDFLAKLKSKASSDDPCNKPYTTFECLTAYLWRKITSARNLEGEVTTKVRIPVNGRFRLRNPAVPMRYFGNVVVWAWPRSKVKDLWTKRVGHAAWLIHDAISRVDDDYFKSSIDFSEKMEGLLSTCESKGEAVLRFFGLLRIVPSLSATGDVGVFVNLFEKNMGSFIDGLFPFPATRAFISEPSVFMASSSAASSNNLFYPYLLNLNVSNFVSLKLTHNNFLLWKTQILALIESQDMEGFLTGSTPAPPNSIIDLADPQKLISNLKFESWRRSDHLVKGWVTGTLSESVLGFVVGLNSSQKIWSTLIDAFAQKSQERGFHLTHMLTTCKKDNDALEVYVAKFKAICDDLGAIGKSVGGKEKKPSGFSKDWVKATSLS
ncbi:hypothetical protein EJ110_NYTH36755 [Nymphaea thermarum]|nr:hypothetical protein EJ110_NYTH36755 [Nymphaea thermarum]